MHNKEQKQKKVSFGGTKYEKYSVSGLDTTNIDNSIICPTILEQTIIDESNLNEDKENKKIISEESIFSVSVRNKIEDFEQKIKKESVNEGLNQPIQLPPMIDLGELKSNKPTINFTNNFATNENTTDNIFNYRNKNYNPTEYNNLDVDSSNYSLNNNNKNRSFNTKEFDTINFSGKNFEEKYNRNLIEESEILESQKDEKSEVVDTQKFDEFFAVKNNPSIQPTDIVDTRDIKNLLQHNSINIFDELSRKEIRFYARDQIKLKRPSIAKINSQTQPELLLYHLNFTKLIANNLNNLVTFLLNYHEEIKNDHTRFSDAVDLNLFNESGIDKKLQDLKQISRIIFKISWFNLLKNKEIQFNNLLAERDSILKEDLLNIQEQKNILKMKNEEKSKKIQELKLKIEKINENVISSKNNSNLYELEVLKRMVEDNYAVNESYKSELDQLNDKLISAKSLFHQLIGQNNSLKIEIQELENKIRNKNVGEKEFLEIKDKFKKFCSITDLELIRITKSDFIIKIGDYHCNFTISPSTFIIVDSFSYYIYNKENELIFDFFLKNQNYNNKLLRNAIEEVLFINYRVKNLINELNFIKYKAHLSIEETKNSLFIKINKVGKQLEERIVEINDRLEVKINGLKQENWVFDDCCVKK